MALPHLAPGAIADVAPLGPALATARTHALFKAADLEVVRLVLRAGASLPPHAVAGEITIQCIEGRVALDCDGGERELGAGQLVHLAGSQPHGLRALEDASLILTIALRPARTHGV